MRRIAIRAMLMAGTMVAASSAQAQLAGEVPPPERAIIDENGVNVATGVYRTEQATLVLGAGAGALTVLRQHSDSVYRHAFINLNAAGRVGDRLNVIVGSESYGFFRTQSGFDSANGDGARLSKSDRTYTLTTSSGTRFIFAYHFAPNHHRSQEQYAYLSEIRDPGGMTEILSWTVAGYSDCNAEGRWGEQPPRICDQDTAPVENVIRLGSITNSAGYSAVFSYAANHVFNAGGVDDWQKVAGIAGHNTHRQDEILPSVSIVRSQAQSNGASSITEDVSDALGRTTRFTQHFGGSGHYESIRRADAATDSLRIDMIGGRVASVSRGGATWSYSYAEPTTEQLEVKVRVPSGGTRAYVSQKSRGLPTRIEDEAGSVTTYQYDDRGRVTSATGPRGQTTTYDYDGRGNVTRTTVTAPGGATLTGVARYPADCSGGRICDQPTSVTDARGVVTSFSYDPTHGGVTSVEVRGANGQAGPRTETRYSEVAGVWLPTSSWTCTTQAMCEGTADAVRTVVAYDANLQPESVTQGAGDGSMAMTTTTRYTAAGDVAAVDGPAAGAGDTIDYRWNLARELVTTITPAPGPGQARVRTDAHYAAPGLVDVVRLGTSDAAGNGFALRLETATHYDAHDRPIRQVIRTPDGAVQARNDTGYDAAGRVRCTTVRMDPMRFGEALEACSGSTGPAGPDRVRRTDYDAAGRATSVTSAWGTAAASTESQVYGAGGLVSSVSDGRGNMTAFEYDAFDRMHRVRFPAAGGGGVSSGDYEEFAYDADGNVTSRRLRDGQVLRYVHDALGRKIRDDNPKTGVAEVDATYSYDLLGRVTRATDQNGWYADYAYDVLGRVVRQSSNLSPTGTTLAYDGAGRMIRQTWADGLFVTYEYDTTGKVTAVRERGDFTLAGYTYDDLGRRTGVTRGNGTTTSYAYDAAGRQAGLGHDLGGTARDVRFDYGYNAGGQITNRTVSNPAYVFAGQYSVDRPYVTNGLNQYTGSGAVALGYDARGNLTTSGTTTFGYNSRNQLTSGPGATLVYRNPVGLVNHMIRSNGSVLNFDHVGANLTTEYDGHTGAIERRYVYGPGIDEPILWYEGAGTGDRRWLHADERGSVIAVSDASGTATAVNTYDDHGIPGRHNEGRFQYTGQKWMAELGVYDYKARMYSPTLGRFMQTDPIGYADGMNWYGYAGGDAINNTDPSGLSACPTPAADEIVVCGRKQPKKNVIGAVVSAARLVNQGLCALGIKLFGGCKKKNKVAVTPASPSNIPAPGPQKSEPRHCYGPPQGPKGISAGELAAQAKQNGDQAAQLSATDLGWFKSQVQNSGPWDYKQYDRGFQDYGNYNYGYTGTRQGIPGPVLRAGAGYAQIRARTSSLSFITSAFDDPRDQEQINRGISDAQNRCY